MTCPLCGGKMIDGTTTLPFNMQATGSVIVVFNVPALVCDRCGDEFVAVDTTRTVEKLVKRSEDDGLRMGFVAYRKAA